MTRAKATNNKRKRLRNPMIPNKRPKFRNMQHFDGQNLSVTLYVGATVTAANVGGDFHQVGTDQNISVLRPMNATVKQYREYIIRSVSLEWVPSIGPASVDAGSRVFIAYTQNPEHISAVMAMTNAQRVAFCKGSRNCIMFNAWERLTHKIPLLPRRKRFDVNTIAATNDDNVNDRAVQGLIVIGYESITAAVVLGTWKATTEAELYGLDIDVNAIV